MTRRLTGSYLAYSYLNRVMGLVHLADYSFNLLVRLSPAAAPFTHKFDCYLAVCSFPYES
jgi:hypothetical protein